MWKTMAFTVFQIRLIKEIIWRSFSYHLCSCALGGTFWVGRRDTGSCESCQWDNCPPPSPDSCTGRLCCGGWISWRIRNIHRTRTPRSAYQRTDLRTLCTGCPEVGRLKINNPIWEECRLAFFNYPSPSPTPKKSSVFHFQSCFTSRLITAKWAKLRY